MKARVRWVEERTFLAESESGHIIPLGVTQTPDGRRLSPSPMELVLIGMGGCASIDVVHILEKSREPIDHCVVELEAERADADPKVFTRIHAHFVVGGRGLDAAKVSRAIELSAEKYCSVSVMLGKSADVSHDFEIVESEGEAPAPRGRSQA